MRLLFLGTSDFAVPSLRALAAGSHKVAAVVTRPDSRAGRGRCLRASPIKEAARALSLPLLQPLRVGEPDCCRELEALSPDLCIVIAYGQILPKSVLSIARQGCVNVHASLLPKYRGAAPIRRALMAGETTTGITTMWMSEGLDEGDIILQRSLPIGETETYGELHDRLAEAAAALLSETLAAIAEGRAQARAQAAAQATYAPAIGPADRKIVWSCSAERIFNQIRAMHPTPGAYSLRGSKRLKISRAEKSALAEGIPGRIVEIHAKGPLVATGEGGLLLTEVQPEGRKAISGAEFVRGYRPRVGETLE